MQNTSFTEIIRSHRRTYGIKINEKGEIIGLLPWLGSKRFLEKMLIEKEPWVQKQLQKKSLSSPKKFIHGEEFLLFGEKYLLEIKETQKQKIIFENAFCISAKYKQDTEKIFTQWYKKKAKDFFEQRVSFFIQEYGFTLNKIKLSSARTRWGSYSSKGHINLNWRLIQCKKEVIDYVIIHELVHSAYMDHSKKFWQAVYDIMPEYKKHKKWLKDHGSTLFW